GRDPRNGYSDAARGRVARAGTPTTVSPRATSRVTTAPAPTSAPAPIVSPPRITAPEPIDAPCSTTVGSSSHSPCARGRLSSPKSTSSISRYSASLAGPSATVEVLADRARNARKLCLRDAREERQREGLSGDCLADRERSDLVAEAFIGRCEMQCLRIVTAGADSALAQEVREAVGIGGADDVQMP